MLRLPLVDMRALMTGLMTVPDVALLTAPHAVRFVLVQPVKLNVCPSRIPSRPMTSERQRGKDVQFAIADERSCSMTPSSSRFAIPAMLVNARTGERGGEEGKRGVNSPITS